METTLANPERPQKPRRTPWRVAALLAAGAVALAACGGAAASGGGSTTSTPTTLYSAVPSAPAAPTPAGTAPAADPAATDIGIVDFKFTPAALTVKVGTTVVWTNKDAIGHSVNFTTSGIDSKVLNHDDQFTHTFTTPGTYDYICSIHPFMHGSVTVTN